MVRGWEKALLVVVLCPKGRARPAAQGLEPSALEQSGQTRNKEQLVFSQSINSLASLLRPEQRANYCNGVVGKGSGPERPEKPLGLGEALRPHDCPENTDRFLPKMLLAGSG